MATRQEVLALMQEDEFSGLETLRQIGAEAVPVLLEILNTPSLPSLLRKRAIVALGEIGSPAGADQIKQFLTDDDPVQRLMAAHALAKISKGEACPTLLPLLDDPDFSVRKIVIQDLSEVGDETVLDKLIKLRDSANEDLLRQVAANAITRIESRIS